MRTALHGPFAFLLGLAAACGASHSSMLDDSETHFLECTEDDDCETLGAGHSCQGGVCRETPDAEPPLESEVACGVDEDELRGPTERVAITTVLTNANVSMVVGYAGGAMFIDDQERVWRLLRGDDEPTVLREPAGDPELKRVTALVSDGEAIYWITATMPPASPLPDPVFPEPPCTIERMNTDGSGHMVLAESDEVVFESLSVDGEHVYFSDWEQSSLERIAKGGGEIETVIDPLGGTPVRHGDHFYWTAYGEGLKRADVQSGEVELVVSVEDDARIDTAQEIQATESAIVLILDDPKQPDGTPDQTIARLDEGEGCLRFFDLPDNGITYHLRPQGDDVYWKGFTHGAVGPGTPEAGARLWRTDVNTGETVELEPDQLAVTLTTDVLGQDEHNLYVTTGGNLIRIAK